MTTVMSGQSKPMDNLKNHKGISDSGTVSSPLARLLSINPHLRLIKLANKSPLIVNKPNSIPVQNPNPKSNDAQPPKPDENTIPRQVFERPNTGRPSPKHRPLSTGHAKRFPISLEAITGAPLAASKRINA